jgi:hypothetical protein
MDLIVATDSKANCSETGKNLGVRRRYPPVVNDAWYTCPVAH